MLSYDLAYSTLPGTKGNTPRALVKDGSCSWEVDEIPFDVHLFKDESGSFSTKEMTLKVKEVRNKIIIYPWF